MKKYLTNKSIINKIIIVLAIVILFNFAIPVKSNAWYETAGGIIVEQISNALGFVGDVIMTAVEWCFTGVWRWVVDYEAGKIQNPEYDRWTDENKIDLPNIAVTPDNIMGGKIAALSINFIESLQTEQNADGETVLSDKDKIDAKNSGTIRGIVNLRDVIAKWYVALRTLALVGLLSVLVYTGIKIILSSTAQDKAKYKERLMDWFVAICLLFFLHYIMLFTIKITDSLVDMLDTTGQPIAIIDEKIETNGRMVFARFKEFVDDYGLVAMDIDEYYASGRSEGVWGEYYIFADGATDLETSWTYAKCSWTYNGKKYEMKTSIPNPWTGTRHIQEFKENGTDMLENLNIVGSEYEAQNLVEYARLYNELKDMAQKLAYLIIYIVLVIYTIMFAFRYIKRVIYMAFLTLMAPMVALTYPIDKMKDGQAQAFNMWLKEYVFNALIQPFHLLIYTVLVGSAIELAASNLIYAIVAIGFVLPAETLLRKFFGFESASTLSRVGSFAAGAGIASMFNMLKKPPKVPGMGSGKGGDKGGSSDTTGRDDQINYYNSNAGSALDELGAGALTTGNDNTGANQLVLGGTSAADANSSNNGENLPSRELSEQQRRQLEAQQQATQDAGTAGGVNGQENTQQLNANRHQNRQTEAVQGKRKWYRKAGFTKPAAFLKRTFRKGGIGRKVIKGVAKGTVGAIGAAAGATVGIAAGVASGDISKAFQYGSLGLGAGAIAGSNTVDAATGIVSGGYNMLKNMPDKIETAYDNYSDTYHQMHDTAEEYQDYQRQQQLTQREREMEKFRKNDTALTKEFGKAEAERIMEQALPDYFDNNITNGQEIAAIESMRQDIQRENAAISEEQARSQAMQEFRVNRELKSRGLSKHKDKVEEIRNRLMTNSGMNETAAKAQAESIVKHGNTMTDYIQRNSEKK